MKIFSESNWGQDEKSLYVGSELDGIDFLVRIFEESRYDFTFEILRDEILQRKEYRTFSNLEDANLCAEEFLADEMNTYSMRLGRGPIINY